MQLLGSQSMEQRNTQIEAFSNDPDVRVFLMSLKAGGVALNLTAASYVEGASLHQERGGAAVLARYAYNELWSFIAGYSQTLVPNLLLSTEGRQSKPT